MEQRFEHSPESPEQICLVLVGDNQSIGEFHHKCPTLSTKTDLQGPILSVSIPPKTTSKGLAHLLANHPEINVHLDRAALARLCDPANYLGQAGVMVDKVLHRRDERMRIGA